MSRTFLLSPGLRRYLLPAAWLLAALGLALMASHGHAAAPEAVVVRVVGPVGPIVQGSAFVVTLRVEGAANVGAVEFDFGSNSAIASTTAADIHLGTFLGSTGRTTGELRLASSPSAPDRPLYAAYSYGLPAGPSGTGQLATVAMRAVAAGTSSLQLGNLKVTDIAGTEVAATSVSGTVVVSPPARPLYLPLVRSNWL